MDTCCDCGKEIPTVEHFDCNNCGAHCCRRCVATHDCEMEGYCLGDCDEEGDADA